MKYLLLLALSGLALAEAPLGVDDFEWRQGILSRGGEALYRFEVPENAYTASLSANLGDVRVFNGKGEALPFAVLHSPTQARLWFHPVVQTSNAAGTYEFDSAGLPVDALRLNLPQPNTLAPLRLYRRNGEKGPWNEVANSVAYRLQRQGQEAISPDIPLPRSRERHWRLQVNQQGGGFGAGLPGIDLGWVPQQVVFVARGPAPYTLAYGKRGLAPADFNIATLVPGYKPEGFTALPKVALGPPEHNADAKPIAADINWRTLGLWSILILGVAMLAAMAWRLVGQMGTGRE